MPRARRFTEHHATVPRAPDWKEPAYKDIVREQSQFRESLPLPLLNYPDVYATWIAFQEAEGTQPYLCSCHRAACLAFLRLNERTQTYRLSRDSSLVHHFLPPGVSEANSLHAQTFAEFEALPLFHDHLCHLCNRRVPSVRWSNHDTHSIFQQHLGWYFNVALYAEGTSPFGDVTDSLDMELRSLVRVDPENAQRALNEFQSARMLGYGAFEGRETVFDAAIPGLVEMRQLHRTLADQKKAIARLIEARLRAQLGFPKHGKTGGAEILLLWIIKALFPSEEIVHRARPEFLRGLQLDIFIPGRACAIEYQGEQHFEPFDHLGGSCHFRQVRSRDARKAALCKEHNVDLRYFTVADKLTEDYVASRLADWLT